MMHPVAARGVRVPLLATAATLLLLLSARAPAQPGQPEPGSRPGWAPQPRVVDRTGTVIRQGPAEWSGGWNRAEAPLMKQEPARPISGTVSVWRLRHKVPWRALKEFERALVCGHKGDSQAAIAHLEKAIEIDQAYLEAYNDLGVRQMLLNRPEEAIAQYRQALSLDSTAAIVHTNLGVAYAMMRRFPEAEQAARQGLKYDPTSNNLRFVLGVALDAQRREPQEALENSQAAAREFPRAHLLTARILAREGDRNRAAAELKKYLRSGIAKDRQQAQTWLGELEK